MHDQMQFGRQVYDFALEARETASMAALVAALHVRIAPLGMIAAASGYVSGPRIASPNPFHFANWPNDWLAYYMEHGLVLIDPSVRWARNSGRATTWSGLFRTLPPSDLGHKAVLAAARFGYTEGMIVPMRSSDNFLGLVCFGGKREALNRDEETFLTIIARCAFEEAERIERVDGGGGRMAPVFTPREIECLALLVRGHTEKQIAEILGISLPTVRYHMFNAREKSGAKSRTHLAALAITQGFATV